MPIDVQVPFSDGWWLKRLTKALNARPVKPSSQIAESRRYRFGRRDWMDLLWSYNVGEAPLPDVSQKHREATKEFLRLARANYGQLAVEALMDRVQLVGVRTGQDQDADGDDVVRRMIEANGAWLQDTLGYAFSMGLGYAFVGPGEDADQALITAEDPRQAIAVTDPVRPWITRAALKTYRDEDLGLSVAHLFLPAGKDPETGEILPDRARVAVKTTGGGQGFVFTPSSWEWDEDRSGQLKVQGLGVPVVPFNNRLGMGEYEPHLDLLDRINNMIADRLWTSKLQAFRQRALRAKEGTPGLPETDGQGKKIDYDDLFEADPGALWELPPGIDIWESQPLDVTGLLASVRDDVREFSAVTRTPLSMFAPEGENQSAAGAESADDGLVFKADDRTTRMTPATLRTYRLALAYAGHTDRASGPLTAVWAPTRRLTLEQRGQAATAGRASGVPQASIFSELWQFDPGTTARMMREVRADQAAALFAPTSQQPADG